MLCDVYGSFESLALEMYLCTWLHEHMLLPQELYNTVCVTAVIDDVQDASNNQHKSLYLKCSNACSLHLE